MAHVLLPGTSPFEESHYEHMLGTLGWRNVARYSAPVFAPENRPDEWALCLNLAFSYQHAGHVANATELAAFEDELVAASIRQHVDDASGPLHGRDVQELLGLVEPDRGVERLLDVGIRAGRFGDAFGKRDGLTLEKIKAEPDGIDLGALRPRLAEMIHHADGIMDLAPAMILDEIERLKGTPLPTGLQLIGRRNIKTNNSWLHGVEGLNKGVDVCVIELNVADAAKREIHSGDRVRLFNANGAIEASATVSNDLAAGVVCLPHGFARANYNLLAAAAVVDMPSGTSALNEISVEVERVKEASMKPR